jgi:hypothetical protein
MERGDKIAIGFFSAISLGCVVSLFIPVVYQIHFNRGIFDGLPLWMALVACLVFCAGFVVIKLVNVGRHKKGRRPL